MRPLLALIIVAVCPVCTALADEKESTGGKLSLPKSNPPTMAIAGMDKQGRIALRILSPDVPLPGLRRRAQAKDDDG